MVFKGGCREGGGRRRKLKILDAAVDLFSNKITRSMQYSMSHVTPLPSV